MKLVLTALAVAALAIAIGGTIETQYLYTDVTNKRLYKSLNGAEACTTAAKLVDIYPYQSIGLNLYVSANDGDSAMVVVEYQLTDYVNSTGVGHWPVAWTAIDTFYGSPNDTLRSAAQRWTAVQYYPPVSRYIRFRAYGLSGNDSLTVIDSFGISGYRD